MGPTTLAEAGYDAVGHHNRVTLPVYGNRSTPALLNDQELPHHAQILVV